MDFQKKRELILNGNMKKVILTLALPVMLNNFIHTLYNLTDTFFISKIGGNEVAGVQFVWPVVFLMLSFGIGMTTATSALISQYIGAGDHKKAGNMAGQAIILLLGMSLVFGTIGYFAAPYVVRWMGATGTLYENGVAYLSVMFAGLFSQFMMNAFNAIKQGQGDTMSPLIIGALSVGLNIILDPIFIFVLDLGITGAALATVLSTAIFAIYGIVSVFGDQQSLAVSVADLKPNKKAIGKIVEIGLPSSMGQAMAAFGFTVLNVFLVSFGEIVLTAFAIGNRINSLIMMPAMGIGSALAPVVGQNLGADNIDRAKNAVWTSVKLSTIILIIGAGIMLPFSRGIVALFSTDPEVIASGTEYLRVILISVPLMGYFQIFVGTFQGSGHTLYAMVLMMGRLWALRIPMIMYLSNSSGFGPSSIWYAMVISNFLTCIVGLGIYLSGKWQKKVIKTRRKKVQEVAA
ncbi:MATE family efflux transporter [Fusibacter tunisiensis]|uniref:MATE family efflux protein n=1 Tax=Fusibacter tunisiensis TaxID=1008308 RepID=A0ABS2MSG9_9FIRM|nr:MATE family efflux transporter [Fusibacter tunisiensis]MBM7562336.1 putative MATE family efflux protein [Fusibacter tunisiensis]